MDEKTYTYRSHIFTMNKFVKIFSPIICIFGLVLMFLLDNILLGFFLIVIGVFDFYMYGNLVTTKFILREEEFEYRVKNTSRIIRYEDIKKLDSRSINYFGGWLLIVPNEGRPIRLTVVIHNVGDMIFTLKTKFDELNMSDRYDEIKLAQFYKTAVYSERSWIRGGKILPWLILGMLLELVMFSIQLILSLNLTFLILFIASLFIEIIPYMYFEFGIYAKELRKTVLNESWDLPEMNPELDKKRIRLSLLWFWAVAIITIGVPWLIMFFS